MLFAVDKRTADTLAKAFRHMTEEMTSDVDMAKFAYACGEERRGA
jgi:hypothetical protein